MSVQVTFHCGGCDATAEGTAPLRVEFVSFSGRGHGFGQVRPRNTVEDVTPKGWVAYDPYTYCTYCPTCWTEIQCPVLASSGLAQQREGDPELLRTLGEAFGALCPECGNGLRLCEHCKKCPAGVARLEYAGEGDGA